MDNLDMLTVSQLYDRLESEQKRMERLRQMALAGAVDRAGYDAARSKVDAISGELERRGLPAERPQQQLPF